MTIRFTARVVLVAVTGVALATADASPTNADDADSAAALLFSANESGSGYFADEYEPEDESASAAAAPIEEANEVELFTERYPNGKPKVERQVTLDAEGNYVNHGSWKMYDAASKVVAEGQFEMGRRVGIWSRWHQRDDSPVFTQAPFNRFQAPFLSQANFSNGQLDGEWLIYDAKQQKCSQVSIRNGTRHGMAIVWMTGGKVLRQTTYDNGIPVGEVMQLNAQSGEVERAATYIKGRQVVSKTTNFPRRNAKKTEAQFLAPKTIETSPDDFWNVRFAQYDTEGEHLRHGVSRTWHPTGQLQLQGQYNYDNRVGQFVYWHPNGQKAAEGRFADDKHEGTWVWWHENGQKAAIGHYEDGALVGRWRWWNETGKLAKQMVYDEPQAVSAAESEEADRVDVGSNDEFNLKF